MEIRLGILEEDGVSKFSLADSLTIDTYNKAIECIREIFQFNQSKSLLKIVTNNENELTSFLEAAFNEIKTKSVKWNGVSDLDTERLRFEFNRHLLNYLSLFRTFIDHSETFLKRRHKPDLTKFNEFKVVASKIYDDHFSYRFFCELRNYSQHCGLPLDNFRFSLKNQPQTNDQQITLTIAFDRDILLQNFDWKPILKKDLQGKERIFHFLPLFTEMKTHLKTISDSLEKIVATSMFDSAFFLNELSKHLRKDDNKVAIFSDIQVNQNGTYKNFTIQYIPFTLIDSIFAIV